MSTATVFWKPAAEKPASDTTVLLFDQAASEPVWMGFFDGGLWREVDGMPATPTHWAQLPEGPKV